MNTIKPLLPLLFLTLSSCSTDQTLEKLRIENDSLQKKITSYQGEVASLEMQLKNSQSKNAELTVFSENLHSEKVSRTEESSNLRAEVRQFIRGEMDDFRDFFKSSDISDYIGGELIDRSNLQGSNQTIIDFNHVFKKKGRLLGATLRTSQPTAFSVLVFRPVEDQLIVLWKSEQFRVAGNGNNKVGFKLDVTVDKGDILGFSFPEKVGVSYNDKTGDTGIIEGQVQSGTLISLSQIEKRDEKRSYSAGVYGFFSD